MVFGWFFFAGVLWGVRLRQIDSMVLDIGHSTIFIVCLGFGGGFFVKNEHSVLIR